MARTKLTAYRDASPPRPYRCLLEPGQDGPAAPAPLLQLGSGGSEIIACLPHNGTNMFSFYIMSMATGKSYAYPLYSRDWFLPNPVIWTEEDRLKLSATRQPVFWRDEVAKLGYSRDGGFASVVRVYEQGKGWMRMKKSRAYKDMTEGWDKKGPAVEAYAQRSLVELSQYEQQQQQQQQPKQGGAYATFTSFYKGDITLKGVLGQGAYGTVRHGEIRSTGYQVAVKFWDRQEDRSACLHANLGMLVVEPTPTLLRPLGILRGSGIAEGLVFPAFGSGTTLDDLWNLRYDGGDGREEQVPLRTLLAAVVPVVEAVACMHRAGMNHCDIKPANIATRIMVARNPELRPAYLERGVEALLRAAKTAHPAACKDVGAAALRDLGLDNYND